MGLIKILLSVFLFMFCFSTYGATQPPQGWTEAQVIELNGLPNNETIDGSGKIWVYNNTQEQKKTFFDSITGMIMLSNIINALTPLPTSRASMAINNTANAAANDGLSSVLKSKPEHVTVSTIIVRFDTNGKVIGGPMNYEKLITTTVNTSNTNVYSLPDSREVHSSDCYILNDATGLIVFPTLEIAIHDGAIPHACIN